jgi:hypothetical protein
MNMRTTFRICGLVFGLVLGLAALSAPLARAATVTRFAISGTTANVLLVVSTPGALPNCPVDVVVSLIASTSVQRSNNTTSTGAFGYLQRFDNCTGDFEFGSFSVSLPSTAFTTGSGTAALNATIPVTFEIFGSAGPRTVTLVATLHLQNLENNSVAARSFGIIRSPSFLFITRSRGTSNATSVTGQLTLDGSNLITPQASIDSDIETGTTANIEITR